ncbi:unnamed protein product [Polarella glacialis]|uniref:V-type proton ATPase subunit D n=1 Tax=Polarella glacialis TaxID=89957 RepID=A0A813EQY8_POLGL|nr:unnamed protein product [Polarella glacialis]
MPESMPAANRSTLQTFKAKKAGATKGHKLLKQKRDALKGRFQLLLKEIVEIKLVVGEALKDGSFAMAKAQWATAGDDIAATVIERAKKPSITMKLYPDNVAGVSIPVFKLNHDVALDAPAQTLSIANGGAVIGACRETYQKAVIALVRLASLQTAFFTLDEEIKMTSRRVNALEYVLIPQIESVCHYITQEMDEQSREEFFRVKKVVAKKKAKLENERVQLLKDAAEAAAATPGASLAPVAAKEAALPAPSILEAEAKKDSDIMF